MNGKHSKNNIRTLKNVKKVYGPYGEEGKYRHVILRFKNGKSKSLSLKRYQELLKEKDNSSLEFENEDVGYKIQCNLNPDQKVAAEVSVIGCTDDRWSTMKNVYEACNVANVKVPTEVEDFMRSKQFKTEHDKLMEEGCLSTYEDEDDSGLSYYIMVDKLPVGTKIIRMKPAIKDPIEIKFT